MRSRNKEIKKSHAAVETDPLELVGLSEESDESQHVIVEKSTVNPDDLIMSDDEYSVETEY